MSDYKIALITGATGGIGGAIAKELVNNGMKVVITGRNQKKLDKLITELGNDNVLYSKSFDITNYEEMKQFVLDIKNAGIVVDTLINNAGNAFGLAAFQDYDDADMINMIDLNVKSLMLLSRLVLNDMAANNKGIIVNVGSVAGQFAYPNGSVYCASKAAVKTLSDGMRVDLMKTDIKVTTIMPGLVETDFSLVRFKGDQEKADAVYKGIDALQAEDIANATWFVINQPRRCQISEIVILANQQGNGFTNYKK